MIEIFITCFSNTHNNSSRSFSEWELQEVCELYGIVSESEDASLGKFLSFTCGSKDLKDNIYRIPNVNFTHEILMNLNILYIPFVDLLSSVFKESISVFNFSHV